MYETEKVKTNTNVGQPEDHNDPSSGKDLENIFVKEN